MKLVLNHHRGIKLDQDKSHVSLENLPCQVQNQSISWDLAVTELQLCLQQCLNRQKSDLKEKKTVTDLHPHAHHSPFFLSNFFLFRRQRIICIFSDILLEKITA